MLSLFSRSAKWAFTASSTVRRVVNRDLVDAARQVQVLHLKPRIGRITAQAENGENDELR